ncbi:MAG: hypothetical protein HRT37_26630 [Alteromonadaceae bacterium]|nr:hypothetical protein [Alteromonadaceae bacterium]
MKLGYKTDDNGHEIIATTITPARIKELDVNLHVSVNHDVSYPLQSSHNKGFHIIVKDTNNQVITDFNIDNIKSESELIESSNKFFTSEDSFVMITSSTAGETFPYDEKVYNQTAMNNKSYSSFDDDLEELEDNAERIVDVFLNDELRWQVK